MYSQLQMHFSQYDENHQLAKRLQLHSKNEKSYQPENFRSYRKSKYEGNHEAFFLIFVLVF